MYKRILFIFLLVISVGHINAQQPLGATKITTGAINTGNGKYYHATNQENEAPRAIEFNDPTVTASDFLSSINSYFNISEEFEFIETESNTDDIGMRHHYMQQYYQDIPLEGLGYRVHEKNGFVTSANGKAIHSINIDISTNLNEEQAFDLAVNYLQTKDTIFRNGKKLIVSKNFTYAPESFAVAYQFDIDVSLIEQWRISIDARTGDMINKVSLVNSCMAPPPVYVTGTGLTNYYGSKTIRVEKLESGSSRLSGQTEHGGYIGTFDFRNADVFPFLFGLKPNVSNFYSSNGIFNSTNQKPAVSVHWAAEQAFEYFYTYHNRNSFDNKGRAITSYVHVDKDLDNAFWARNTLLFGDGSNGNPPVELDVVSHELTHGVTQYEARLQYSYESGALNESFSDIFAKAVEFTTLGNEATWQLARHFRVGGLRDMSNPNLKNQPDTYQGDMWYNGYEDNGGVHVNSGVQNFWFYLLCEGGSGVNDQNLSYSVNPIGMNTAINIAYRNLTEYLSSSSDYLDSRIGSLLATADLYGKNSSAYQEVDKAWDAVGVIDEPIITSLNTYDITATTVKINGSILPRGNNVTYYFEYGTTPAFGNATSNYNYNGTVEGMITGLQSETGYYVRIVVTNENGSSYGNTEFTTKSLTPLVIIKNTVDVTDTSATFHGQVNPNSLSTSFYFEYGPTPNMGLVSSSYPLPDTTEFLNVSAPITGLQPRQTYYYKLIATNNFASVETDSVRFYTALKPVISSFSPVTATVGTEVTIIGEHFHLTPEKNWVGFGATRATVLSSSTTEIKVLVPQGATFGPISLLDAESGLMTESIIEFVPTYTGGFGKWDMQLRATFNEIAIHKMVVHDMDGDGRPDIVASHNEGLTIFQNVNAGEDITNESFIPSNIPVNISFSFKKLIDMDGNGLKDIVGYIQDGVRIYPNFSVPGYVFFGVPIDLPIGYWGYIQFNDFDSDGHIDIAGIGSLPGDGSMFTIFRNQNPRGTLSSNSFEQQYSKILPYNYINFLTTGDLTNDGKPDLILSALATDHFSVLENKSIPGVFEFDEIIIHDSIRERTAHYVTIDLNQDSWKETITYSPYEPAATALFESKGSGLIQLHRIKSLKGSIVRSIQSGDINGDGKVDILVGDYDGRFIFLKNKFVFGEQLSDSSFELFGHYGINDNNYKVSSEVILSDLNGDGRPEVINNLGYSFYPFEGHQLEIWQNSPNNCLDPSLISIEVFKTSATIFLPSNTILDDFEIEYAYEGSSNWRRLTSTNLTYLSVGASYQIRARAACYLGFTNYHYIYFTTECVELGSFFISDIQINKVLLNATDLSSFEVQYSEEGKDQWINVSRNANQISNLKPGTTYDLQYRGRCYTPTDFNNIQFTTLCPSLTSITIKDQTYNKAVVNWASDYQGEAVFEYSADNISWIEVDETRTMFPLIPGIEYFVRGRLSCTNIDSDFTYISFFTPCPWVSMLTVNDITPFSAEINWEDKSGTGSYIVKYLNSVGESKTVVTNSTSIYLDNLSPGTQYTVSVSPECVGEKDFTTSTFTTVCYVPFNLSAQDVTYTTAELLWNDSYSGVPYSIDYAIEGSNDWISIESTSTMVSLENLRPGTTYEARVHINCTSVTASFASASFKTSLYGKTMFAPNPTESKLTIYPSKNIIGNKYGIYDNTGRRVASGILLDYTFDFSEFSAGVYILKIEDEKIMKIIKR